MTLFELPKLQPMAQVAPPPVDGFALRDYQSADVAATLDAFAIGKRAVICRWATGTGKAVFAAELSRILSARGRVLVIVDVTNLADDLVRTIDRHTGKMPGMLTGSTKEGWQRRRIVVATVQTLYAGGAGKEWYRELRPQDFAAVICDECETSIADRYSSVLRYFKEGNPDLVMAGCTATPFRGDGRGMGEIYDHASDEPGPLNRDILWGRDNGWLVHIRQAFVRVSLDFATLKLRKDEDGVKDYTDKDLVKLFEDESPLVELAKGIHKVAQGQPSIVICPNSVEFAKKLSHYLDSECRGCSNAIYGEQGRRANDLIEAHKRGAYAYAVSVNKLYKGYDFDGVRYVFMCRKTRSRRLYEQALGRGSRPLSEIREALNAAPDADARRKIIFDSNKPWMVMVDMVGVHPSAKDLGVIDILGSRLSERAREFAKSAMMEDADKVHETEDAGIVAQRGLDAEARREAERRRVEEAKQRERKERRQRRLFQIGAQVDVEYTDDLRVSGAAADRVHVEDQASEKQTRLLIALGVNPDRAVKCGRRQAGAMITSYKKRGVRADWSLVNRWERRQREPEVTDLSAVPVSQWQRDQLGRLGHTGALPSDYASATRAIRELSMGAMA